MSYSAQLTALAPYSVTTPFLEGKVNQIEIPVINGVSSSLSNFIINGNGNLQYSGTEKKKIVVKAKWSFGQQQPSQIDPSSPLDFGPKVCTFCYIQVGSQQSVPTTFDQTLYYSAFEYPLIFCSLDVDQEFEFNPGDIIQLFAYYTWILAPTAPVDPTTFYITLNQVNLSWLINSTDCPRHIDIPKPVHEETKVAIPLGTAVNTSLYELKSNISGTTLISVRMNIRQAILHNNDTTLDTDVINTNWFAYLAVNNVLVPNVIVYQTITNQPNLLLPDYQVWTASLELLLLADLQIGDKVEVIANITGALAPLATPPYVLPVTNGYVTASLEFDTIMTPPLCPSGMVVPVYNSSLYLPLDGNLDKAVEFPLDGCELKYSDDFKLQDGKLVYTGEHSKRFKVRSALNFARFLLLNSNLDPAVITLQHAGFAVGVNGKAYNDIRTFTNIYTDSRYGATSASDMQWLSNQSATNDIHLHCGDYISVLLYTRDVRYLNVPPAIGTVIPNLTPPVGSVMQVTASASIVIE